MGWIMNTTDKIIKEKEFKKFKEWIAEECYVLDKYKNGKYDRKIFNYFQKALKQAEEDLIDKIEKEIATYNYHGDYDGDRFVDLLKLLSNLKEKELGAK